MTGRTLAERAVTFGYDLRMRCEWCGNASLLSGADYSRLNNEAEARVDCQHCDQSIHYGPLVAAIRDPDDPALNDDVVNQLAWYHSSTFADWPSATYEAPLRAAWEPARRRGLFSDHERYLRLQLGKALHLGTYEAAIENMFRRMRDQADEHSTFFLHRVSVNIPPGRLNTGFRDENKEPAADIAVADLDELDLDAVRYLNVWEASGCVSLAIRPEVMTSIQTMQIPRSTAQLPASVLDLVATFGTMLDAAAGRGAGIPGSQQQLGTYQLIAEFDDALVKHYLHNVSPLVADDVSDAIRSHQPADAIDFLARADAFARHADLLTSPEQVIADAAAAAPRFV